MITENITPEQAKSVSQPLSRRQTKKESASLKPFLKWAGGKSRLLSQLTPFFPRQFERYCEPFTGSAAVYWQLFNLRERWKVSFDGVRLADSNAELINCYAVARDCVEPLIERLTAYRKEHDNITYYKTRNLRVSALTPIERAARFIYLNKTCYNGLYRVNRDGQFNVPIGSYKNPSIFDAQELRKVSRALQGVEIQQTDFRNTLNWAKKGDFIYFDPPYAPLSKTANFTSYTEHPFGETEQQELAEIFCQLDKRGCKLMLSNSFVHAIAALYKNFQLIEVKAARAINSNPEKRGKISELLVINYAPRRV